MFIFIILAFLVSLAIFKSFFSSKTSGKSGNDINIQNQNMLNQQNIQNQITQDLTNQSVIDQVNIQNQIQNQITTEQQHIHH